MWKLNKGDKGDVVENLERQGTQCNLEETKVPYCK